MEALDLGYHTRVFARVLLSRSGSNDRGQTETRREVTVEPEKNSDERDVFVSLKESDIKAGDLITAHECGYQRGYMRALCHAAVIIFACMMLAAFLEGRN
jgi:hypothetical protein